MKVITFAVLKGSVGKTTLSYNWGQWLAQNGSKILLIDADYQLSLTTTFENMTTADFTTFDTFMGENIELQKINDNLSLIPGSVQ